jgi:polyphosphate:AMP phosphotransferase
MMFDRYDLSKKADQKEYDKTVPALQARFGELQRELRTAGIPLILVVEGWNASGISNTVSELIHALDPRGFTFYATGSPNDEEKAHTFLWRFWVKTPAKGRIAIFARGWYSRLLAERMGGISWKENEKQSLRTIRAFEQQLADDGTIVLKFFLHISKEEQKRRLEERERDHLTSWMITRGDWDFHNQYDQYLPLIEDVIKDTDSKDAPWTIVEATDPRFAAIRVYTVLIKTLEARLSAAKKGEKQTDHKKDDQKRSGSILSPVDHSLSLSKTEYLEQLKIVQGQVRERQYQIFKRGIPLMIVYEGWDAAGKGGNILRLTQNLNPRGYSVVPISVPNDIEKAHHYLWRFYTSAPPAGSIRIFDRSWYGRVLVERVEGFCTDEEWGRAYNEINQMEEAFLACGGGLVKFWLEIDKDEQLRRFEQRQNDPAKQWKITPDDWRNREKWDQYTLAVDEMLTKTSTKQAPWTIIESDDKYYARIKALNTVVSYIDTLL